MTDDSGGAGPEDPNANAGKGRSALPGAHAVLRRWLGDEYDLDVFNAVAAAAAAERLDGDPLWLLVISGPGAAKTETVQALTGAGAIVVSAISSEAALLSATPRSERSDDATGGLLHAIGDRGLLVIKDVTSILEMDRRLRARVLAALREIHDGHWYRDVGSEGGRRLEWRGRIGIVGAVTTAWDQKHAVIASMGDRFVCVRMDSTSGRLAAGRRAISNLGAEKTMREQLAAVTRAVVACVDASRPIKLTSDETERLLAVANLVTLSRTAAERDYRGYVVDVHAPEMPTRFPKQLAQMMRGAVAIGLPRDEAFDLALRCARDSMPPLRLGILEDVAAHPNASTNDVRKRLARPRATVDRELQALHMLEVLDCEEEAIGGGDRVRWRYTLAEGIDPSVLRVRSD